VVRREEEQGSMQARASTEASNGKAKAEGQE
jgi:hypothetical protein